MSETKRRSSRLATTPVKSLREDGSDADSESDEEFAADARPAKQSRQRAGKKAETSKAATSPKAKAPRASKKPNQTVDTSKISEMSFLEIVLGQPSAITHRAKAWVGEYKEDKNEAMGKLLTFLVQATGLDAEVTKEDVEDGEVDQLVLDLAEQAKQEGAADLFHAKGVRNFRANYRTMWEAVMRECHTAEVLDDHITEKLTDLVIALTLSVVRPFRFVGTLTASQLVSSWTAIQVVLTSSREQAQYQLQAEEKKKNKNTAVIASFKKRMNDCHLKVGSLKALTDNMFQAVFAHRFRDVSEEIRAVVVDGIGAWVALLPSTFLNDQYLKYLAWALSDKDPLVRSAAVSALQRLYDAPENIMPLHEFTARFSYRFIELIYDVDEDVAVQGVTLLTKLVTAGEIKTGGEVKAPGDKAAQVSDVYKLLADDSLRLRHAAAELVARSLEDRVKQQTPSAAAKKSKGKAAAAADKEQEALRHIDALLHIMRQLQGSAEELPEADSQDPFPAAGALPTDIVSGIADALYDRVDVLHDWEALTGALLDDALVEARESMDNTHLAALLAASLKRSSSSSEKRHTKAASRKADDEEQEQAALVLMRALPTLLRKFQTEAAMVASFLSAVRSLHLDVYLLKQDLPAFEDLVKLISDLLLRHSNDEVLRQAALSLLHCCNNGPASLQDSATLVLNSCIDALAGKLLSAARAVRALDAGDLADSVAALADGRRDAASEPVFALRLALARLHALQVRGAKAIASQADIYSAIDNLLSEMASGKDLGSALTPLAINVMYTMLLWNLAELGRTGGAKDGVQRLAQQRDRFLSHLSRIYEHATEHQVKDSVFKAMSDMLVVFGGKKWEGTAMEGAALEPRDDIVRQCWNHCAAVLNRDAAASQRSTADESVEEDEEREEDEVATQAKVLAVAAVGRLVALETAPRQQRWLAVNLVSHMAAHGKEVTEVVREVCKAIRKKAPDSLPDIYLGAMKATFATAQARSDNTAALQAFSDLCQKIAATYAGFNLSVPALMHIIRGGIEYGSSNPPSRLPFLAWGLAPFTPKLPPSEAAVIGEELEAVAALRPEDADEEQWEPLQLYMQGIKERAARGKATKTALKTAAGKGRAGAAKRRKIAFEAAEEEEEPEASDEQQQEDEAAAEPGPSNRGAAGTSKQGAAAGRAAARKAKGAAGPSRTSLDSEEEEEPEGPAPTASAIHKGKAPIGHVRKRAADDEDEESEEPAPAAKAPAKGKGAAAPSRKRKAQEQEEEEEGEESEEPAPVAKAPAKEKAAGAAARKRKAQEEEEEEEEEPAPVSKAAGKKKAAAAPARKRKAREGAQEEDGEGEASEEQAPTPRKGKVAAASKRTAAMQGSPASLQASDMAASPSVSKRSLRSSGSLAATEGTPGSLAATEGTPSMSDGFGMMPTEEQLPSGRRGQKPIAEEEPEDMQMDEDEGAAQEQDEEEAPSPKAVVVDADSQELQASPDEPPPRPKRRRRI